MLHHIMLILLSSWITDLTRSDSPSRAIVLLCFNALSHVYRSAQPLHTKPSPQNPPKPSCSGAKIKLYLLLRQLRKLPLPGEGCTSPWESNSLSLKALKKRCGSQKKFRPAANLSCGNTDAPQKQRFAPRWAVQSYAQGCVSLRSCKFTPWLRLPITAAHPCSHRKETAEQGNRSSPFPNI